METDRIERPRDPYCGFSVDADRLTALRASPADPMFAYTKSYITKIAVANIVSAYPRICNSLFRALPKNHYIEVVGPPKIRAHRAAMVANRP